VNDDLDFQRRTKMNLCQTIFEVWTGSIGTNRRRQLPGMRRCLAFTLIELLVVISIIALLASLIVGLARNAGPSNKRSRIQAERDQVITAIEAYKAHFGHYPPDNVAPASKIVNPVTNPLFYELSGVIVDEKKGMFHARDRQMFITSGDAVNSFNRDGFVNAGTNPKEVKSFIDLKASQRRIISKPPAHDIEVLAVSVDWPNDPRFPPPFDTPEPSIRRVNPWRYVSTNPTNNPDSFDLWAEFVEGGKIKVICNWSKDVLDK
jgi:prepilin-type N-terminal cleavage/methylation domain-containing protein